LFYKIIITRRIYNNAQENFFPVVIISPYCVNIMSEPKWWVSQVWTNFIKNTTKDGSYSSSFINQKLESLHYFPAIMQILNSNTDY